MLPRIQEKPRRPVSRILSNSSQRDSAKRNGFGLCEVEHRLLANKGDEIHCNADPHKQSADAARGSGKSPGDIEEHSKIIDRCVERHMLTAIVASATSLPCPFSHQFKSFCGCRFFSRDWEKIIVSFL